MQRTMMQRPMMLGANNAPGGMQALQDYYKRMGQEPEARMRMLFDKYDGGPNQSAGGAAGYGGGMFGHLPPRPPLQAGGYGQMFGQQRPQWPYGMGGMRPGWSRRGTQGVTPSGPTAVGAKGGMGQRPGQQIYNPWLWPQQPQDPRKPPQFYGQPGYGEQQTLQQPWGRNQLY